MDNRHKDGNHWRYGVQIQKGAHYVRAVENFPQMPSKCGEITSPLASHSLLDKQAKQALILFSEKY